MGGKRDKERLLHLLVAVIALACSSVTLSGTLAAFVYSAHEGVIVA